MTWTELSNPLYDDSNVYWELPCSQKAGNVWIRLPGFSSSLSGNIYIGIGDNLSEGRPDQIEFRLEKISNFGRIYKFEIPRLTSPVLGLRLSIEGGVDVEVKPEFQFFSICNCEALAMAFYRETQDLGLRTVDEIPSVSQTPGMGKYHYSQSGEIISYNSNFGLWLEPQRRVSSSVNTQPRADWETVDLSTIGDLEQFELDLPNSQMLRAISFSSFRDGTDNVRFFLVIAGEYYESIQVSLGNFQQVWHTSFVDAAGEVVNGVQLLDGVKSFSFGALSATPEVVDIGVNYSHFYAPTADPE